MSDQYGHAVMNYTTLQLLYVVFYISLQEIWYLLTHIYPYGHQP